MIRPPLDPHQEHMGAPELASTALGPALPTAKPVDDARITTIVRTYHDFIWRLLRRLGIPAANVDDATQQVFCVAARRIDEIAPGSERSFLFGTALRVASDDRRSARHREQPDGELDRHVSPQPDPEDLVEKNRRRRLLDEILSAMPIELRAILVLFELEQMTKSEVAELLGIPEGTTMSRLRRARKEFQAIARRRIARDGFTKVAP
jgi:RNA polymerase sigma-70 factor (ECF subfamily)